MTALKFSPPQLKQFESDGYLLIRGLFGAQEMPLLRRSGPVGGWSSSLPVAWTWCGIGTG